QQVHPLVGHGVLRQRHRRRRLVPVQPVHGHQPALHGAAAAAVLLRPALLHAGHRRGGAVLEMTEVAVRFRTLTVAVALVASVATVAATAGCGGSDSGGGGSKTVTWMSWETNQTNAALDASFAKFAKSSGITAKREAAPNADYAQKLASLIMSKKVPD